MFNINPLENLRVFISSRPPLVVFMISVSAMAIAFLTLGYFFKIKEIKSPEMTENETLKHLINDTTTPENAMTSSQARPSTPSPQTLEDSGPVNTSVAITLTLDPLRPFGGISRNVTSLSSTIFGHQIGLSEVDQSNCDKATQSSVLKRLLSQKHDPLPPSSRSDQVCNHCLLNPEVGPDWLWIYHETLDYSNQRLLKCL
ncbi:hypothetical protein Chor_006029 [Crotalus horridus]